MIARSIAPNLFPLELSPAMRMPRVCPRCHQLLVPDAERDSLFACRPCGGTLDLAAPATIFEPSTQPESGHLACPECLQPMFEERGGEMLHHRCLSCGSLWEDHQQAVETKSSVAVAKVRQEPASFTQQLLFGLSLPERLLRTVVGVSAGTVRDAARFLVPQAFQNSVTYQVAIRNSLNFLTEGVGGFESESGEQGAAAEYLARKTVGNFIELAGLTLLPVSPLWLLAAISDIAHGSSTYVRELAAELQTQGIIDDTSTIHSIDDLLKAIRTSSSKISTVFDQPPFSVAELQDVINETRASVTTADLRKLLPESEVRRYWDELKQSARQQDSSLWQISTAVAMSTYRRLGMTAQGAVTGVNVAQRLIGRNLLDQFRQSLQTINKEGLLTIIQDAYEPYVSRVWDNFQLDRKSWTESALDPANVKGTIRWAAQLLTGSSMTDSNSPN